MGGRNVCWCLGHSCVTKKRGFIWARQICFGRWEIFFSKKCTLEDWRLETGGTHRVPSLSFLLNHETYSSLLCAPGPS